MVTARTIVDSDGSIRLPDEVRSAAHLRPGRELNVTFAFGVITVSPENDNWRVCDGFVAGLEEALGDGRLGRVTRHGDDAAFVTALQQRQRQ